MFQFPEEATEDCEELVLYEEEVLEDESPTDRYQWSIESDPNYMSPVSLQMATQAPVRQRETAPVGVM